MDICVYIYTYGYIYIYIYIHILCMCVYLSMGQLADFVQLHQSRQRTRYTESVLPMQRIRSQLRAASMALNKAMDQHAGVLATSMLYYYCITISTIIYLHNWA